MIFLFFPWKYVMLILPVLQQNASPTSPQGRVLNATFITWQSNTLYIEKQIICA